MSYLTVLFDLDGTLYSRDELIRRLIEDQYREFRRELSHIRADDYVKRVIELDAHGYEPKEQVYQQIADEFHLPPGSSASLLAHFWDTYDSYCHLPEDSLLTLQTLRAREIKLALVTNGQTARQNRKIDALGIRDYFAAIVVSEAEGIKKPAAEIFHRALRRCGASAESAVFVGDHPVADIDGARNAGLSAVWKKVSYWNMTRADVRTVEQLSEILTWS